MDVFRVRLNCIDHYQAAPTDYDPQFAQDVRFSHSRKSPKVPVIRVFGSTEAGQKVCAHIHGAFPYLYVEYDGSLEDAKANEYIAKLRASIDHALAVSYRKDPVRDRPMYVARITLTKGIPFYGFHVGYRFYLKIYLFNPVVMSRLVDLLQQGVIMSQKFQPYEAHLQYLLQFMADYNLYGCDYLDAAMVTFRAPVPKHDENIQGHETEHPWDDAKIPSELITDDYSLPRASHCSLEVDICVEDILNRKQVKERRLHHDFIEGEQPVSSQEKLVHSMAGLWTDETNRRKRRMGITDPEVNPFPPEVLASMSADPRQSQVMGWVHETEYRAGIRQLVAQEQDNTDECQKTFSGFVQPVPFEETIKTALESVEDLYPENLSQALQVEAQLFHMNAQPHSSIDVDERTILQLAGEWNANRPPPEHADRISPREPINGVGEGFGVGDSITYDTGRRRRVHQSRTSIRHKLFKIAKAYSSKQPANTGKQAGALGPGERQRISLKHPRPLGDAAYDAPAKRQMLRAEDSREAVRLKANGPQSASEMAPIKAQSKAREAAQPGPQGHPPERAHEKSNKRVHEDAQAKAHRKAQQKSLEQGLEHDQKQDQQKTQEQAGEQSQGEVQGAVPENLTSPRPARTVQPIDPSDQDPTVEQPLATILKVERPKPKASQPTKSAMKQSSAKESQGRTFNFPVVKDPQDPNTRARLSQKSGSQKNEEMVAKKQLAFDPQPTILGSSAQAKPSQTERILKSSSKPFDSAPAASAPVLLWSGSNKMFVLDNKPPSLSEVRCTMQVHGLPDVIYQDAYYSKDEDVPPKPREYAGREYRLDGSSVPWLPDFDPTGTSPATFGEKLTSGADWPMLEAIYEAQQEDFAMRSWEIAEPPPSFKEVSEWWADKQKGRNTKRRLFTPLRIKTARSQVAGATPKNKHGFRYSEKEKSTSVQHQAQYMSTMSLEVHVNTRGKLVPDPEEDEVQCVFWCLRSDENALRGTQAPDNTARGIIVFSEDGLLADKIRKYTSVPVRQETTELDVMVRMVEIVRSHDPDIFTGYEVHGSSWGYLIERARIKYDLDLCDEFSRMKSQSNGRIGKDADRWGFNTTSSIRITGRHMINIWRAMRGELNLLQYTMENVVWHLLHRRIPHYSWKTLSDWYLSGRPKDLDKVLRYYLTRTRLDIEILEKNELIPRTSEQARLLGVDFFSVFSRGSQFKVESIMFRIAKPENFLLVSPSRKQVGAQNALECLPLVMEPLSAFYSSPLLVLDFQSLYPSVMIAYNYCYSTFLGRIVSWRGTNKMGFMDYKRQEGLLSLLKDYINIAPNGMMYTKPHIRKSLLAKMLTEILETRIMVKSGMKQDKDDKALQQLLNNRQLALKLLANVTYGYTSASFSGRMPCSEIADSIVQTGRETLERAIAFIHSVQKWDAEVVYGDTDSLFVYLKGRTREQAFDIGQEIADAVTKMNPRPVKLKFEKVYHPCVLIAKKRYVGYKYESRDQTVPEFDAKGIETVRRDGTPAEQRIEEKALKILFETADLSQVKSYFQEQCHKIMRGAVSVQDFCFAREVKLGTYSTSGRGGPAPAGALIATKKMREDARAEPQYGERVPYVVMAGAPGMRLVDRCVEPEELLNNSHATLDADYYINKNIIPPLERIFNLVGANVRTWYEEMPKVQVLRKVVEDEDAAAAAAAAPRGPLLGLLLGASPSKKGAAAAAALDTAEDVLGEDGEPLPPDVAAAQAQARKTLEAFLNTTICTACGVKIKRPLGVGLARELGMLFDGGEEGAVDRGLPLCRRCASDPPTLMVDMQTKVSRAEKSYAEIIKVCQSCAGFAPPEDEVPCDSKDCPVFYSRVKQRTKMTAEKRVMEPLIRLFGDLELGKEGGSEGEDGEEEEGNWELEGGSEVVSGRGRMEVQEDAGRRYEEEGEEAKSEAIVRGKGRAVSEEQRENDGFLDSSFRGLKAASLDW
ncbi:DNA polymerase zeta [Neurospora sp. IMI 360204]|nr:DNA polymerase zeta [Neurospora sp. IMI 360204]